MSNDAILPDAPFDGETYDDSHDHDRLRTQLLAVYKLMRDGEWRTLYEISEALQSKYPEQSISARLRDFRKEKFGEHIVERRPRGVRAQGIFEYRLVVEEDDTTLDDLWIESTKDMTSGRCSACPAKFHVIHGTGPIRCRVAALGQNPGKSEEASACRDEVGQVFIGQAGMELNQHYLPLAGLSRNEDVWVDNVVCCHTENDRRPTTKEIQACSSHFLPDKLEYYDPEIVILMGSVPCSLVPSIDLQTHHGYPFKAILYGKERWFFPVNHPAAGMHNPAMMTPLIQDFERLGKVLRGDYSTPINRWPEPTYEDLTGNHEKLRHILLQPYHDMTMARDTETIGATPDEPSFKHEPWCSTFTIEPGTGYMIRAVDHEGLAMLVQAIPRFFSIFHNKLFDRNIEEKMGFPDSADDMFDDTMQLAYHQGDLPLGLKPLGWRLCGMTMKDYNDVVMPYSRQAVLEWLEQAFEIAAATPGVKWTVKKRKQPKTAKAYAKLMAELAGQELELKDGYYQYSVPSECDSPLTKKIIHIYKHTSKEIPEDGTAYNPWSAFKEQVEGTLGAEAAYEITSRIGAMPKASIEQVFIRSPHDAINYACADSDGTRRIHPILKDRQSNKYADIVMLGDIDQ